MIAPQVAITGGTGALGRAVVATMLERGAHCHVTFVVDDELADFEQRDAVHLHRVDCTSEQAVTDFYGAIPTLHASIHLVGGFAMAGIEDTTLADFEHMLRLNACTTFLCCREAVKRMRATAGTGRIVNVGSRAAVEPGGQVVAYASAKAAVAAVTRSLAAEVLADGILVNAVLPSTMDTPQNRRDMPRARFDRWPKVEQVAAAIAFLAGPENAVTSGALLPVYGAS